MSEYVIRLDDASEYRNKEKWDRVEGILDKYCIHPLVGVVPKTECEVLMREQNHDDLWDVVREWERKKWTIALHGYTHKFKNLADNKGEFYNIEYLEAKERIRNAYSIFAAHNFSPKVFFAPNHQFNNNTIRALLEETDIRTISDGYSSRPYEKNGMKFVPAQTGTVKKMPFKIITFVYHPNTMPENEFLELDSFLAAYKDDFIDFPIEPKCYKRTPLDVGKEFGLKASRVIRKVL